MSKITRTARRIRRKNLNINEGISFQRAIFLEEIRRKLEFIERDVNQLESPLAAYTDLQQSVKWFNEYLTENRDRWFNI